MFYMFAAMLQAYSSIPPVGFKSWMSILTHRRDNMFNVDLEVAYCPWYRFSETVLPHRCPHINESNGVRSGDHGG